MRLRKNFKNKVRYDVAQETSIKNSDEINNFGGYFQLLTLNQYFLALRLHYITL